MWRLIWRLIRSNPPARLWLVGGAVVVGFVTFSQLLLFCFMRFPGKWTFAPGLFNVAVLNLSYFAFFTLWYATFPLGTRLNNAKHWGTLHFWFSAVAFIFPPLTQVVMLMQMARFFAEAFMAHPNAAVPSANTLAAGSSLEAACLLAGLLCFVIGLRVARRAPLEVGPS